MASRSNPVALMLLLMTGCATGPFLDPDHQADLVERKLAETGETRVVAGAATAPTVFTFELNKRLPDGTYAWGLQQVAMVHVVAGDLNVGFAIYKVGLVADQPVIVCKTGLHSNVYDIVWESWPDGRQRAGSQPPSRIQFTP